jgi:hypothetical protein
MESDSEATGQESAGRTRGTKRGAASFSEPSREEAVEEERDEEEEATSSPKGKETLEVPDEQWAKRARQSTLRETHFSL